MVRKLAAALALAGFALGLAASNTVEGMGKAIQAGGAAIESAADKSKPK